MFPEAQFLITGVSGPSANAHGACLYSLRRGVISSCCHGAIFAGPNEFLHIEYVKKQKLELEGNLRTDIQKWRGEAEAAERKVQSLKDELKGALNKLKLTTDDYENLSRSVAVKSSHMN